MITAHEWSAAYVKSQQQAEQPKLDHRSSYEPHCLMEWKTSVSAVDETAGIQDKEQVK